VTEGTSIRCVAGRGDLVKVLYRLGRQAASGVLTITVAGTARAEIFVLRRGGVVMTDNEQATKALLVRLARLVSVERMSITFEPGRAYPPGANHQLPLAPWARAHLEQQLDGTLADLLLRELAGIRLSVRIGLAPDPTTCDDADRRMLAALATPRRIDQIWSLARTPRFRLLAFIHFLRSVDALDVDGIVADRLPRSRPVDARRSAARRLLGIEDDADLEQIKRAYRRLARELHPDLQPDCDLHARRVLEKRFAEVTAAYEALL
jgi:hypothetical protein